jgi:hypothetical protein
MAGSQNSGVRRKDICYVTAHTKVNTATDKQKIEELLEEVFSVRSVMRLCVGQGENGHINYKRLKLGSVQAYDRSNDQAVVVA